MAAQQQRLSQHGTHLRHRAAHPASHPEAHLTLQVPTSLRMHTGNRSNLRDPQINCKRVDTPCKHVECHAALKAFKVRFDTTFR